LIAKSGQDKKKVQGGKIREREKERGRQKAVNIFWMNEHFEIFFYFSFSPATSTLCVVWHENVI
jgi:hypothetical protein